MATAHAELEYHPAHIPHLALMRKLSRYCTSPAVDILTLHWHAGKMHASDCSESLDMEMLSNL